MITKLVINDRKNTPVGYVAGLKEFKKGRTFNFSPKINIIIGENGSGKTTLLKLIYRYMLVDGHTSSFSGIGNLIKRFQDKGIPEGVDIYGDYTKTVFKLCHADEMKERSDDLGMQSFLNFGTMFNQINSSTGEGVNEAFGLLLKIMFSKDTDLKFPQIDETDYPDLVEYIKEHKVDCEDRYTVLMDEPDRNLSLDNVYEIRDILSLSREDMQIICVIHNPLLIYSLKDNKDITFIEMTRGYLKKVINAVEELTGKK